MLISCLEGMTSTQLQPALLKLLTLLDPNLPGVDVDLSRMPPLLLLAFDEAHLLAYPKTPKGQQPKPTAFSEMRHGLRKMIDFPVFSLFLSTMGNIHDFTPPPKDDPSKWAADEILHLYPPFTKLGFDQMLRADSLNKSSNRFDVDYVSRIGFMVRLGRPL